MKKIIFLTMVTLTSIIAKADLVTYNVFSSNRGNSYLGTNDKNSVCSVNFLDQDDEVVSIYISFNNDITRMNSVADIFSEGGIMSMSPGSFSKSFLKNKLVSSSTSFMDTIAGNHTSGTQIVISYESDHSIISIEEKNTDDETINSCVF